MKAASASAQAARVARVSRAVVLTLCTGVLLHAAGRAHAALPQQVAGQFARAGIPQNRVAVYIQALDAAQPLLEHNADAALNPASVMKLVTSYAALDTLGPAWRWQTEFRADGVLRDGVLDGNLAVKGYGDPTLTLERIWLMQRALRQAGVNRITGGLILDATAFDLPPADPGAFDDAPLAPYNAPPGALIANFNVFPLRFSVDQGAVRVTPEIASDALALDANLQLADGACRDWRDDLVVSRAENPAVLRLIGRYPQACGSQTLALNLFDPLSNFDLIFRGLWAESAPAFGSAAVVDTAPERPLLLVFESVPLAEALVAQNKHSNNLMTRNLFLSLGAAVYGGVATPEKGAQAVRRALVGKRLPTAKLVLENGAGLSRIERVSARLLGAMLQDVATQPWAAEFEASLPLAARDGTLARRYADSPVAGQAHLKTGSLRDVSSLAGYLHNRAGQKLVFVVLVNHANARRSQAAQQALLEWAWQAETEKP